MIWMLLACAPDPCEGDSANLTCSVATQSVDYYAELSSRYFDTMDSRVDLEEEMPYSEQVVRWEWGPWLKLTAFGRDDMIAVDAALVLYPSIVDERDCRGFDVQPFGRCTVTFYYDAHDGKPCPIYEEFVFNDAGEITWIEAWSYLPGYLPMEGTDPWADGVDHGRLSARIPGLGTPTGAIDLESQAMADAAAADADVADFAARADDWQAAWLDEVANNDQDAMWAEGCGW